MHERPLQSRQDGDEHGRLLQTLQRILEIEAVALRPALNDVTNVLAEAFQIEKIDAFFLHTATTTLVALGTSDTPLGRQQRALGLDRLPLAGRGRIVEVFETGAPYLTGHADQDPGELVGITDALGVRSTLAVALHVGGVRRGVLAAASTQPESFSVTDLRLFEAIAHWVGVLAHRAELVEQLAAQAAQEGRRSAAEELIMVLAHDLRNYLAPITLRIDALHRRARREGRPIDLADTEAVRGAVQRLGGLVTDLLDMSRLERGIFSLNLQAADLAGITRDVAEALGTHMVPLGVQAPDSLMACVDPSRLRQALENLLGNAIKHSPPGGTVSVRLEQQARPDGPWARLSIADQGPGVAPEILPRLFERFIAGAQSSGLGLGLYLAERIAAAHGGTLTVESAPGKGACFTLGLPLRWEVCPGALAASC